MDKIAATREEVIKWLAAGRCPECSFTFKACTCGPMIRMLLYIAAENKAAESELREMREALAELPLAMLDKEIENIDAAEFVDNAAAFIEAMLKAKAVLARKAGS